MKKFDTFEFAKRLTETPSVSGHEFMAFDTLKELCADYFTEITTLPTGCFIGYRPCGKKDAKKLILDAHLDEIGFVISEICDGGFVKVERVGGIDTRVLSASEAWIYADDGRIPGVFCVKPPHLMEPGDEEKKILLKDMYLDTGLSKEELEKRIRIGTPAGFKVTTERLLNNCIVGKGMDDKICATTIMRAVDMLKGDKLDVDIYVLFSGGEETGYIGGKTGSYYIDADFAVVLDVTNSYLPETPDHMKYVKLGDGGVIDFSSTTSRKHTKLMVEAVKEAGIKHQISTCPMYTGTNSTPIHISRNGIPVVLISLPLRNMHTPAEVISLDDVENTAAAVAAYVRKLK